MKQPCRRVALLLTLAICLFVSFHIISLDRWTPRPEAIDATFRPLAGDDFFLYSAYMDGERLVKIVGMKKGGSERIFCSMDFGENEVEAEVYEVPEKSRSVFFAPIVITCDFRSRRAIFNPAQIRLTRNDVSVVLEISTSPNPKFHLAKCLPIFYGSIDLQFLLSLLNLNSKNGVDHFRFYAHPGAYSILTDFFKNSTHTLKYTISIKKWNLPVRPFEIWYYGQLIMLQDCLYSLRTSAGRILVADLDEYPMPTDPAVPFSSQIDSETVSAWNFATMDDEDCFRGRKSIKGKPNWKLTKYVVRPRGVTGLGVHRVVGFEGKARVVNVSDRKAVIAHCRTRIETN